MFANLDTSGTEAQEDRLGGTFTSETGVYDATIKVAYVVPSRTSDSKAIHAIVDLGNGQELAQRTYFLNKAGQPTYEKNDKKFVLPGFEEVDALVTLATGVSIKDTPIEEKTLQIWDGDAQKELPKSVPVLTALTGKPIAVAVTKQIVNKQKKVGDKWIDTNDTREENVITKYFRFDSKLTMVEAVKVAGGAPAPAEGERFYDKWAEKYTGQTVNRFKEVKGAPAGGGNDSSAAGASKSKALFGN